MLLYCFGGRGPPFSARAPPSFEVYSRKLKIQEVYDGKEKGFLQSISGEDVELLAQFTGKLDKVLHNKRVSYLRKKNQKETKEVSFEANASYLESVSCRIEVSVEECIEEKLMLEETDKHLQNLPVREYTVITCPYINEMSVKETAKELRIKHNTVSTHKKNATALIRKKMEDK